MKRTIILIRCLGDKIKNKFFNNKRDDNGHACSELKKFDEKMLSEEEAEQVEEYITKYSSTTRWQTV